LHHQGCGPSSAKVSPVRWLLSKDLIKQSYGVQITGPDGKQQPGRDLLLFEGVTPRFLNIAKEHLFMGEQELCGR